MPKVIALVPVYHPDFGRKDVGAKFEMSEDDIPRYERDKLVVRAGVQAEVLPELKLDESTLAQLLARWDYDLSASAYLTKFPDGTLSDLALRIVELEADAFEKQ